MRAPVLQKRPEARPAKVPIVVKLGGSVVRSSELGAWLDAIAASPEPVVVVPGGGALADEVRACQTHLGFGDANAHRMALLAMDQLAWAVAGLRRGFAVGATETELNDALARGAVAVWAPYALISGRSDIEESWRLTSDSLALWLAERIGAERCYLIKSVDPVTCEPRGAPARARWRGGPGLSRHARSDARHGDPARPRRPAGFRRSPCRGHALRRRA